MTTRSRVDTPLCRHWRNPSELTTNPSLTYPLSPWVWFQHLILRNNLENCLLLNLCVTLATFQFLNISSRISNLWNLFRLFKSIMPWAYIHQPFLLPLSTWTFHCRPLADSICFIPRSACSPHSLQHLIPTTLGLKTILPFPIWVLFPTGTELSKAPHFSTKIKSLSALQWLFVEKYGALLNSVPC